MPQTLEDAEAARLQLGKACDRCSGLARIPALLARIATILHAAIVIGDYWMSRLIEVIEEHLGDHQDHQNEQ